MRGPSLDVRFWSLKTVPTLKRSILHIENTTGRNKLEFCKWEDCFIIGVWWPIDSLCHHQTALWLTQSCVTWPLTWLPRWLIGPCCLWRNVQSFCEARAPYTLNNPVQHEPLTSLITPLSRRNVKVAVSVMSAVTRTPANKRRWPNVDWMLGQRRNSTISGSMSPVLEDDVRVTMVMPRPCILLVIWYTQELCTDSALNCSKAYSV